MFDIDTTIGIDGEDVPVRMEIYHVLKVPPDPKSWDSPEDYYGHREADYKVFRMDTGEEIDMDEDKVFDIIESQLEYE